MTIEVFEVNAFCYNHEGGNGAGVALVQEDLSPYQKQKVAADMGLSETVFVGGSKESGFRLEYFTPAAEVPLCGHATIATFALLQGRGLGEGNYTIDTRAGHFKVRVEAGGRVLMQQGCPTFFEQYEVEDFACCLPTAYYDSRYPIWSVSTGLKDVLFPVDTLEHLYALKPDFEAMARLNEQQCVVGIHAFVVTGEGRAECRNFAPLYGIEEESATGTSNCALACYLHRYHAPVERFSFDQGFAMGSPSRIEVQLEVEDGNIVEVMVGGVGEVLGFRRIEV